MLLDVHRFESDLDHWARKARLRRDLLEAQGENVSYRMDRFFVEEAAPSVMYAAGVKPVELLAFLRDHPRYRLDAVEAAEAACAKPRETVIRVLKLILEDRLEEPRRR